MKRPILWQVAEIAETHLFFSLVFNTMQIQLKFTTHKKHPSRMAWVNVRKSRWACAPFKVLAMVSSLLYVASAFPASELPESIDESNARTNIPVVATNTLSLDDLVRAADNKSERERRWREKNSHVLKMLGYDYDAPPRAPAASPTPQPGQHSDVTQDDGAGFWRNTWQQLASTVGGSSGNDEAAVSRIVRPRLEAHARLYEIFCESSKHPARTRACEGLFAKILDRLWNIDVKNAEDVKNAVRAYKRVYDMID